MDTTGTVGAFEPAFNVKINTYRAAPSVTGPRTFFTNDGPVTLPAAISAAVESVNGLDNFRVMQSNARTGLHRISANATAVNAPTYSAGTVVSSAGGAHANATGHVLASFKAGTLHPNLTSGLIDPTDLWGSNGYDEGPLYALGHCCDPDGTVNDYLEGGFHRRLDRPARLITTTWPSTRPLRPGLPLGRLEHRRHSRLLQ